MFKQKEVFLSKNSKNSKNDNETKEHPMSFLDHLEELRSRLLKIALGVLIGTLVAFFVSDYIMEILLQPAKTLDNPLDLQVLEVQGMFMIKLQIAFIAGLVSSLPLIVHQVWGFIAPGLYEHEKHFLPIVMIVTFVLFMIGLTFAYLMFIPLAISFLTDLGPDYIKFNVSINSYISFVLRLCLLMGAVFEMPLLALLLSKMGLLTSDWLKKFRRQSIVVIFIIAAIFTPPDVITQFFMAVPLLLLYEISIMTVKMVEKKKIQKEKKEKEEEEKEEQNGTS